MQTIWKYELESTDAQNVEMPKNAELLTVQLQNDKLCLWAKVDSDNEIESTQILIRGTGNHIGAVGEYVGTYQLQGGALVFHVFKALSK